MSDETNAILKVMSDAVNPHLEDGITYYASPVKSKSGSSGGMVYTIDDGIMNIRDFEDPVYKAVDELPYGKNISSLIQDFDAYSKIRFTFEKGKPVEMKKCTPQMLMEDMVLEFNKGIQNHSDEEVEYIEAIMEFFPQADETGMNVICSRKMKDKMHTFDFVLDGSDEVECLYHALDKKPEKMHLLYKDGQLKLTASPAFPEYGIEKMTVTEIEGEPEVMAHYEEAKQVESMRLDFFKSLGELHEEIIYLNVGGFRDYPWPGYSTAHRVAKMRVIYTDATTILITDGLTDLYSDRSQDKDNKYNGIGLEFYMEFEGKVPFNDVKNHYMIPLLNSMTQVAIAHGDFRAYIDRKTTSTIEFTVANVETWTVLDNNSNNEISSFFPESDYAENGIIGLVLGMKSDKVPEKLKLTREEVLLLNAKPFGQRWLTSDKLKGDDDSVVDKVRQELIKELEEKDNGNLIPESYVK